MEMQKTAIKKYIGKNKRALPSHPGIKPLVEQRQEGIKESVSNATTKVYQMPL
jgi:hypothetical protein